MSASCRCSVIRCARLSVGKAASGPHRGRAEFRMEPCAALALFQMWRRHKHVLTVLRGDKQFIAIRDGLLPDIPERYKGSSQS